jgi:glycosyltransferase A (GT-A) superfamily protein (DUF2064 family)
MQTCTAILFFSRTAEVEASQKNILAGQRNNLALIKRMIGRTQGLMRRSGLDHFTITENEQVGDSFGERMSTAMQAVFQRGYERVIILGNDCPQLRLTDIQSAEKALENDGNVIGRDQRGGAYLIGLQRSSFVAPTFQQLPWQQPELQEELARYLAIENDFATLKSKASTTSALTQLRILADLATWTDLRRIWRFLLADDFFQALLQLIRLPQFSDREEDKLILLDSYLKHYSRRGPPVLG